MVNAKEQEVGRGLKDVDDMLAEEELVPVRLLVDGLCFGPQFVRCFPEATETLARDTVVKVPLWLAMELQKKNLVRVETPAIYGQSVRDALDAGASSVDLRALSPYYYTVGRHIVDLTRDDDLRKCLRAALAGERFENIFDWSQNADGATDVDDLLEKLTEEERHLFYSSYHAQRDATTGKFRSSNKLRTASVFAKASFHLHGSRP